jgi:hypothetical protein
VLGLNISSAFDSAVTIYIIIPILVIPQLLLSGVVITFDKFNPKVGTPAGIPIVAEAMASRWAFESLIVAQFKNNSYEEAFFEVDQQKANAEYMKQYYLPALESKLSYLFNNKNKWRDKNDVPNSQALDVLHNELKHQLTIFEKARFAEVEGLAVGKFDTIVYAKTKRFLDALKTIYTKRLIDANLKRDELVNQLASKSGGASDAIELKLKFQNDAVNKLVENSLDATKIIEWDGVLIRKFSPIYKDDFRPQNAFDFRSGFYVPKKHFLGRYFETENFNVAVIWFMTVLFLITLYFDLLKKLVLGFELRRKYRAKGA